MISRLLELQLSGFRCYENANVLPLDGDVVVLYGANGCGKTSVFSALEYALTGAVPHLAAFADDYPRSLQNVRTKELGYVALKYGGGGSHIHEIRRGLDRSVTGLELNQEDMRFFQDRCYLSQSELSRLFEAYENASRKDADQPLVRFARELLGLDPLENITEGLHVVGDSRRLDSALEPYRRAKKEGEDLKLKVAELSKRKSVLKNEFDQALVDLEKLLPVGSSPHGHVQWTVETLRARREAIEIDLRNTRHEQLLQSLQRNQGALEAAVRFLTSAEISAGTEKEQVQQRRDEVSKQLDELKLNFAAPIKRLGDLLRKSDPKFVAVAEGAEPALRLDAYEESANRFLSKLQADMASTAEITARLC